MKRRQDGEKSRESLLRSAARIFAQYGYKDATNERLCQACGMNAASVSYYFGSKKELYRAAWLFSHKEGTAMFPMDGGVPQDATPEEKLKGRIHTMLNLSHDQQFYCGQIILKEFANPTHLLDDLWEEVVSRGRRYTESVVQEFFEGQGSADEVNYYAVSISAQCRMPYMTEPGAPHRDIVSVPLDIAVEHVYRFSLDALYAKRDRLLAEKAAREEAGPCTGKVK